VGRYKVANLTFIEVCKAANSVGYSHFARLWTAKIHYPLFQSRTVSGHTRVIPGSYQGRPFSRYARKPLTVRVSGFFIPAIPGIPPLFYSLGDFKGDGDGKKGGGKVCMK